MKSYVHAYLAGPATASALFFVLLAVLPTKNGYEILFFYLFPIAFPVAFLICLLQYFLSVVPTVTLVTRDAGWSSHCAVLALSGLLGAFADVVLVGLLLGSEEAFAGGILGSVVSLVEATVVVMKTTMFEQKKLVSL